MSRSTRMLLQSTAHGCDSLRVKAKPVHSSGEAGVFDLDATIHDHGQAAIIRDARTFRVDHRELTPQTLGADRNGFLRNTGQGVRRAKDIDDINGNRYVAQAGIAPLAKDIRLTGIHRNHAVATPLQVESHKIAGAQRVAR